MISKINSKIKKLSVKKSNTKNFNVSKNTMNSNISLDEVLKIKKLYELKTVDRFCSVKNRKESSAEHTWSSLILADYFLTLKQMKKYKLNRVKVYELLMYHDVVEIYAGDSPLHPDKKYPNKKEDEELAAKKIISNLPKEIAKKYKSLFIEFESGKTKEAKFAKAIDMLDAEIQELDYKDDWKGWTKEFLNDRKQKHFLDFPELMDFFNRLTDYLEKNGYFDK